FSTAEDFSFAIGDSDEAEDDLASPVSQPAEAAGVSPSAPAAQVLTFALKYRDPVALVEAIDGEKRPRAEVLSTSSYVSPATDIERKLAAIWERVLLVSPVGRSDRFHDLGGKSLQMVR